MTAVRCVGHRFFSYIHVCIHSPIPRPKTTVIGLGMGLVHKQNCEQYAQLAWSLSVVVSKVYEHVGSHCVQLLIAAL